ncbi:MAG: hypothetical protein ACYSSN_01965 [Planctomycetota bacterium]|jgi:hypothetical protein
MAKKQNIAILTATAILTLIVSLLTIYSRKNSERNNYISYQKLTSCRERLETIGERIEIYQNQNSGQNPPSLNVVNHFSQAELYKHANAGDANKYEGGECSYVYRGEDLDANTPVNLILAYDRSGNHLGCRNVLFSKPQRIFYLGINEVSKEEYDNFCKRILRSYDPNISIHVKGWKDTRTNIVSADYYTEEQYRTVCRAILNDYNSTDIQIIILEAKTANAGISKAFIEEKRVKNMCEEDFLNIISFDNKLRQELGLPQKSI